MNLIGVTPDELRWEGVSNHQRNLLLAEFRRELVFTREALK